VTYARAQFDPDWLPLLVTPPFPEYPSGHSVQSGAACQVLTDLFGPRYAFVDRTHDERGLAPRRFGSFLEAADEAAVSRLYGGIHFRAAIENGLAQGRRIGRAVSRVPLRR
jgi:PAP2 superfamily